MYSIFLCQGVTRDVWWYYMISLAFYLSLTFYQFFDVKRKDFWPLFIHHIISIVLLSFSWIANLHRVGSLVLLTIDAADFILSVSTCSAHYRPIDTLLPSPPNFGSFRRIRNPWHCRNWALSFIDLDEI